MTVSHKSLTDATRRGLLLATGAFVLSGCALPNLRNLVGPPPPMQLYALRPFPPPTAAPTPHAMLPWQLAVAMPNALATLDSERIALSPMPLKMDYFANAAWPDDLPSVVQSLLIEGFQARHKVAVARDTTGLNADYILQTDIRDFEAVYQNLVLPPPKTDTAAPPSPSPAAAPPRIVVQITAQILAIPGRRIIGSMDSVHRVTAKANTMDAIVTAFNNAAGAAINEIVGWTLRTPPAT